MCGICGELRFDGGAPDLAALQRMMAQLARRGPDNEGGYSSGPVALGHRRLAIIDLSGRANQPMVDSALGLVVAFNGTIYNYRALRAELQALGYRFFFRWRHRSHHQGLCRMGFRLCRTVGRHVRLRGVG